MNDQPSKPGWKSTEAVGFGLCGSSIFALSNGHPSEWVVLGACLAYAVLGVGYMKYRTKAKEKSGGAS